MDEYHVTCVTRSSIDRHESFITHIGGVGATGWKLSKESAISRIESKSEAFYTTDRLTGTKAYIGVVREPGKNPYLKTYANSKWNDNLQSLPECPAHFVVIS